MGICANELSRWVIEPTLQRLGVQHPQAVRLLLATAAQESGLGSHLKADGQRGLGIYQLHSLTHRHVWDDYLVHYPELASTVRGLASQHNFLDNPHAELTTNLIYATAIAWFVYARNPEFSLPDDATDEQLARAWKRFFHPRSTIDPEQFCTNFRRMTDAAAAVA